MKHFNFLLDFTDKAQSSVLVNKKGGGGLRVGLCKQEAQGPHL